MKRAAILLWILFAAITSQSQTFQDLPDMQKYEGFFNFYYNLDKDQICLVVENLETEFLYVHSLSSGLGHNDLGLDRGQIGGQEVVMFIRAGNKLLLIQPNLDYRAVSENELERNAVDQAFARSVLHSFEILDQKDGNYLVDLEGLVFNDAHRVAERLARMRQGNYTIDKPRSAMELSRTRAFPDNVEFDALITFSGHPEGFLVRQVTPDAHHITINQHHSFVRLPDLNFQPRAFHPGSGCISLSYMDYATPVYEPITKRFITRHRLQKKNPGNAISEPVEPIIYYLDNGTPEPVRTALLDGARWWEEAFREIGFENAFRVEMLPDDADPLDVRYNMIQWVHRSTRGWSYGNAVVDPRTGEIIKGHVSLGSLRVRQDFMIAQALLNKPFSKDDANHQAMMDMALARIRQLSVHEVGHTLGFAHNYAASSNGRASVMDYPHPLVYVKNGEVKLDKAYAEGVGEWDKVTVAYAYSEFPENEDAELRSILENARESGLRYISDYDARSPGGAHPYAHLWDNGTSVIDELQNVLDVRKVAMANFSVDNIRTNDPISILEDIFVPLYFYHRYQVEAVTKLVGGMDYSYAVKGDGSEPHRILEAKVQRSALDMVLLTLTPETLMIPEEKMKLFPPRAEGYQRTGESFNHRTGVTFDYLAPPAAAANLTLRFLLHPERANRIVFQKGLDENYPGLEEVIGSLVTTTFHSMKNQEGYISEVAHTIRFIVIDHLISLGDDHGSYPQVKALVKQQLKELSVWLDETELSGINLVYKEAYMEQIKGNKVKYLEHLPEIPPGSPIGMSCMDH